jgi:SAM-dependent methyltransferase
MENKAHKTPEVSPDRQDGLARERDFHNHRFSQKEDPRAHLDSWYQAIRRGAEKQDQMVTELSRNAIVLEYGCSDGGLSINHLALPPLAKRFEGIDISDVAIARANNAVHDLGYRNVSFRVMNGEAMDYEDNTFDVIFGRGIIHHLNLPACYSEVSRVLKPGGCAIFYEPLGHNPAFNWYRRRTPDLRTEGERPLLINDIKLAQQFFSQVNVRFFGLFTLVGVLIDPTAKGTVFRLFDVVDRLALSISFVQRLAWYSLLTFVKQSVGASCRSHTRCIPPGPSGFFGT